MNTHSLACQLAGRCLGWGFPRWGAWAASAALSAVAVAAAAAPAVASTAPSMITNGSATNIAVEGPNHSLHFYWAANGTPAGTPNGSRAPVPPIRRRR